MPRIVITEGAAQGLERCRKFLYEKNPNASRRAAQAIAIAIAIAKQFSLLELNPEIGRAMDNLPEVRELIIEFGDNGYIALYRLEPNTSKVYVLAFRHQKEAGYYY